MVPLVVDVSLVVAAVRAAVSPVLWLVPVALFVPVRLIVSKSDGAEEGNDDEEKEGLGVHCEIRCEI